MKKSDKNFEKQLVTLLTSICEQHKTLTPGFSWLTHTVNFKNISNSLRIICVFNTEQQKIIADQEQRCEHMRADIIKAVKTLGVTITNSMISFDSEESCEQSHQGNWQKRLQQKYH